MSEQKAETAHIRHALIGVEHGRQGAGQTIPEDLALCMSCGWMRVSDYAEHLAAEALRAAAAMLPALTEGPDGIGTARWPESDRNAYSLAIEDAQSTLRALADAPTESADPLEVQPDAPTERGTTDERG